jgi:adenylate cyclase
MTAAQSTCSACGTELRASARFCDGCGGPVAPQKSAEYKQVTVLFADVVRSMEIAAAVGPERLREIMTTLFERCAATVQRYGGTVDKFTGDGIMAVFGAPIALEDHPVRACLTALDIQKEMRGLTAEVQAQDGVDVQLRVGLNSGEVIAGEIGSGAWGYTAVGHQVGMAQRMESVAPPGGVMLSESTAHLVAHATLLGAPQNVYIKGSDEPVVAWPLLSMGVDTRRPEVGAGQPERDAGSGDAGPRLRGEGGRSRRYRQDPHRGPGRGDRGKPWDSALYDLL